MTKYKIEMDNIIYKKNGTICALLKEVKHKLKYSNPEKFKYAIAYLDTINKMVGKLEGMCIPFGMLDKKATLIISEQKIGRAIYFFLSVCVPCKDVVGSMSSKDDNYNYLYSSFDDKLMIFVKDKNYK